MQFTPENKAAFDRLLTRYPVKRSALLPALHMVQDQEGFISSEAIEYLASLLDLTPAQVHDTASFYTMFRLKPEGTPRGRTRCRSGAPRSRCGGVSWGGSAA